MTVVQVLIDESPTRATTFEPMGKPEGGLDLEHPCNRKALRQIDWEAVSKLREREPPPSVDDLFLAAVCNPGSCPIGWSECRRHDWKSCHYYDLLKAVEAIRHEEDDDGRDR
jgi:hypothetical protein